MNRRDTILALLALSTAPQMGRAQQAGKVARVGWLGWTGGPGASASPLTLEAFRAGMRERGWIEGKNLSIETRIGTQVEARSFATELLRLKVDLIVAQGPMIFGARGVDGTLPMVFSINGDPVEAKLVTSLARSGGNLTGITALSEELAEKRIELLKEAVPGIVRVAAIANQAHPGVQIEMRQSQAAAKRLGMKLQWIPVYSVADFEAAFAAIGREGAQAIVAIPDNLINDRAKSIAEFAAIRRIPTVSGWAEFAEAGNLMSYGPELQGFFRHIAVYADKLLRGAKPADLPVEQPTKFALVVNLRSAKALGMKVPQSILLRADRVIE